jgi:hypothetical protein
LSSADVRLAGSIHEALRSVDVSCSRMRATIRTTLSIAAAVTLCMSRPAAHSRASARAQATR